MGHEITVNSEPRQFFVKRKPRPLEYLAGGLIGFGLMVHGATIYQITTDSWEDTPQSTVNGGVFEILGGIAILADKSMVNNSKKRDENLLKSLNEKVNSETTTIKELWENVEYPIYPLIL